MEPLGRFLRREREIKQISLEEIAQTTRVPLRMLQHIEDDQFDLLPGEVFARGFLKSYAASVGLDPVIVLERFGERRANAEAAPAPITAITPPERGRRFGIAIALVILLILFTLALSIVLRPRQRNTPIELSRTTQPLPVAPRSGGVLG
ncbi:MAG: helix-turn-helix domain-containing protein [Sandaracinaceae bacterium]|nr:helix-turn-helix domain-containing protein [Sandaracinaceae bacterium]